MQFSHISVSQNLTSYPSEYKQTFFKNDSVNDVIEGFFFFSKAQEKMSLKIARMNLISV